jgi:hypothetical protein
MSVNGSLVSYQINKKGENSYEAVAKNNNGGLRNDLPEVIELEKNATEWEADPWHNEIVPALTYCIDASA